ncbi:MAG: 2-hydroxyacid dehydrogenase, partial [Candidatus Syntrophosphaera sp.]
MPRIVVTRVIPEPALERLAEVFEVDLDREDKPLSRELLKEKVRDADALLCMLTEKIDAEILDAAPRLKCVANYAVGYNNIDVDHASQKGIAVCNTPGVLTQTTADLAWALIMAAARRIVESDRLVRAGKFKGWEPMLMLGVDIHEKTLGIIGMGRIGQAVARRAQGFDMKILWHDPGADPDKFPSDYQKADLEELCRQSDFISIHAPLTPETRHLIGAEQFALMKKTAVLVNSARGPIVDEAALVEALKEKRIGAAGLDVFEDEPRVSPGLIELPNVVLLPHIGSASVE